MKKLLNALAVAFGVVFLGLAFMYWLTPASSLPTFVPGYDPTISSVHFKHGLASLVVGIALLIFAWFRSGKKDTPAV